jgi:hypothetical protein
MLALLLVPQTNAAQSNLLGMCFAHDLAFPNGPDAADLSQTFCNLVQENMPEEANFSCDGLSTMTGSEFQDLYDAGHAEFCQNNEALVTAVLGGTHPEAQKVYETALAETLFYLQASEDAADAQSEGLRRRLFLGDVVSAMWEFSPGLTIMIGMLLVCAAIALFLVGFAVFMGGRRALTAPADVTSVAISATDVLLECLHGIDSFLCDVPVDQLLQIFSTGVCASAAGLSCVVSQDDFLALGAN